MRVEARLSLGVACAGKWSVAKLSQARQYIVAASAGPGAVFGGGFCSPCTGQPGTDRSVVRPISIFYLSIYSNGNA